MFYNFHKPEEDLFRVKTLNENVQKFRRFGTIITRVARNLKGETAKIGRLDLDDGLCAYVIFYPDGTYDRFENSQVEYRPGWTGPDLSKKRNDDHVADMIIEAEQQLKKEAKRKALTEEARQRKNARARQLYAERKKAGILH